MLADLDLPAELAALKPRLQAGISELGLSLSEAQQQACLAHLGLVAQWGRVYNLTAVRDPADMLTQHLLDCLAVVLPLQRHLAQAGWTLGTGDAPTQKAAPNQLKAQKPRLLDVGSGAGFPGVVLALCLPGLDVVCVDTVAKKAAFIQQAAIALQLPNLRGVHARVETLRDAPFDVVTSRAFASLADFTTLTRFHVKQPSADATAPLPEPAPGVWMALKGQAPQAEMDALAPSVRLERVEPLNVPQLEAQRCLVWMSPAPAP